jgi:hypothetical protein
LLDDQLRVKWHARLALHPPQAPPPIVSAATDPVSGLATWALVDAERTVYLMRSDGLTDHFRISDDLVGLNLLARGERLLLQIVEPQQTIRYQVQWR